MGLNSTPAGERLHIGFFGCRNAGKSSLVNALTGQQLSVVSDVAGTTTDPVKKAMELLPLGPVLIIDTPGYDDTGTLGEKRVEATRTILRKCDIAVLVADATKPKNSVETELEDLFRARGIPFIEVKNKADLLPQQKSDTKTTIYTSARDGSGIEALKSAIAGAVQADTPRQRIVGDLIQPGDFVVLVIPIDAAAPKGRLILPQQQTIRDILDAGGVAAAVRDTELARMLQNAGRPPALVITDSQAFKKVSALVPKAVPLTSFSILMARHKGFLRPAVQGANALDTLPDPAHILISEGCTHHRQCDDIGTVKLPRWLKAYTKKTLQFTFSGGGTFADDLTPFDLVIHCGGCMLNEAEMQYRMQGAAAQGVPFTNYGTAIAKMNGILARSISMLPECAGFV